MRKSIELRHEKGVLNEQYRAILNRIETDKRTGPNTEEKVSLDKMDSQFDMLDRQIKAAEREEEGAQTAGRRNPTGDPKDAQNSGKSAGPRGTAEYSGAFDRFFAGNIAPEIRNALSSDSDTAGGFITASEQFSERFIQAVDNQVFIRQYATKTKLTSAQSLGIPTRTADVDDSDWTAELAVGNLDSSLVFGKRELRPHPLAKQILVSKKLLRLNPMAGEVVMQRLAYKAGVASEKAYLTGTGANQPLGVFTPSTNGIDTSRDVVTGSATGFASTNPADCLFDALYNLKSQYQAKAMWGFHRTTVQAIRKFKDQYGQYLWQPGIAGGEPDRVLNRPYFMSEYVPNTYTTGQYIGIVGDWSTYEIVDALDMSIDIIDQLYAQTNQMLYIARMESDGMPVLAEAFSRLKCS